MLRKYKSALPSRASQELALLSLRLLLLLSLLSKQRLLSCLTHCQLHKACQARCSRLCASTGGGGFSGFAQQPSAFGAAGAAATGNAFGAAAQQGGNAFGGAAQQPTAFGGPQQGTGFGGGFGGFGASASSPAPAQPAAPSNSGMWAMRR